jgi:hypothetical protein
MRTRPITHLISLRKSIAVIATLVVIGIGSQSQAQTPSLDVYYDRLDPKDAFKYKWKGEEKVCNVGAFHWLVPPSEFTTGGLDRNFTGYCAEVNVTINAGKNYRFRLINLLEPSNYGLDVTPEGIRAAERRTTLIRELFGRYYTENKAANPEVTFAFQVALWELTQETQPLDRDVSFDLFAGDFQVNYPKDQAPGYVLKAQQMLDSLTVNDAIYYENQQLAGRELIRLQGIPNAEGEVAQSQYALRYINGGAAGVGALSGSVSGAGGSIGGIGGGGGLLGGGDLGGGGGGGSGGGPLLSTGTPTTTTTTTSSPPPSTGGRVPAGGPSSTPPGTPGQHSFPPGSAPAPAGLVLGLIALGVLASRRVYSKIINK